MNNNYINTLKYFLRYLLQRGIPICLYKYLLKWKYKQLYKLNLDLKNPLRLSEKLQYLKLNDSSKLKTLLSDKIYVKTYVNEKCSDLKTAKIYQTADCFDDINFDTLPDTFVLKTNHAWKTNAYVINKNVLTSKEKKFYKNFYDKVLKINYSYWAYLEMQYKNIKPRIFAEELLKMKYWEISNYEVYCFNGKPEFILFRAVDKFIEQSIYSPCGKKLNFDIEFQTKNITKMPNKIEEAVYYSKKLSKEFDFVRVDFMESNNELYFCEMTFTPYSGFIKFIPEFYDLYYGKKLNLS